MKPVETEIVVVGAGPGGYTAAFAAADRGRKVILVDQQKRPGGVCLNQGCIPSKALLHATELIREGDRSEDRGVRFGPPAIELEKLRRWKESILERLGSGIRMLAQRRGVELLTGQAHFEDSQTLRVEIPEGQRVIRFGKGIIAVGSRPAMPRPFDRGLDNRRIMTSTEALELEEIPRELLVIGAGYIGLELGTVYATLGSRVVLMEQADSILPGADPDLARPVLQVAHKAFQEIHLNSKVSRIETAGEQIKVYWEGDGKEHEGLYDRVLVAVGRVPNSDGLGLEKTQVVRDPAGFIQVDERQQTTDPAIYAIGDVVGGPLLAHKASREARIAVAAMAGEPTGPIREAVIPAVVFTDPEVAWCGLTESEAQQRKIPAEVVRFPWAASGRAVSIDRTDGMTKLILDPQTQRILGVGIVGYGAGELISEGILAMEMGATAKDLARTVHPHPTLSETLMECAQSFYGTATHMITRRRGP